MAHILSLAQVASIGLTAWSNENEKIVIAHLQMGGIFAVFVGIGDQFLNYVGIFH